MEGSLHTNSGNGSALFNKVPETHQMAELTDKICYANMEKGLCTYYTLECARLTYYSGSTQITTVGDTSVYLINHLSSDPNA